MLAALSRMTAARLPPAALLRYKLRYALLRYSFAEALRYALQRRGAALQLRYCVTTLASAL